MPYTYKKQGSKYCVYKKEDGKKVGCTDGNKEALRKYLAALHIHEDVDQIVQDINKPFVPSYQEFINEDYARVHPNPGMNVGGMGPIVIPEVGVYNSTGSGDIPASSPASTSDTELKKKKKNGVVPITYTESKNKKS